MSTVEVMEQDISTQLVELERHGWQALCDGTGATFYGELMTDDAVMILAHGQSLDRAAVVASLEHAPTWDSYEIADPTVVMLGPDQVLLRYTGTG